MVDTITECESFFQNKINGMLVTTSWVDDLKNLLGMEAVSQIWGDVPAWYMWLSDAQGVYQLQLVDAMVDRGVKMVTFDVRNSNTAAKSTEWLPIKPGTDGAVALAMCRESLGNYLVWLVR